MQRAIILAFLAVRAFGSHCGAGYKHKTDLAGLTCNTAASDAASCSSNCCEKNKKTCGGLTVTCASNSYHASTDAWKNTAATEATKAATCCTTKATCGGASYTCPAGYKQNIGTNALKMVQCPGDAASCGIGATCCTANTDLCKSRDPTQTACNAESTSLYGLVAAEKDDAWKKIKPASAAAPVIAKACCGVKSNCASYTCAAGLKKVANAAAVACWGVAGDACSVANKCCVADTATCGGQALVPTCISSEYYPATDTWKNKATTPAKKNTDCCTTKATCAVAVCGAGFKKKANVDSHSCPNNKASCSDTTTGGTCCEKDTTKCGGLTGINCPYGFFDGSATWTSKTKKVVKDAWNNRNATDATKNTDCCTPKAVCVVEGTTTPAVGAATTTPAATVTTTPAAPARLFSEHKAALEQGSPQGANMLWLGVGGLIGMGVLMVVQGLRSRMQEGYAQMRSSQ